MSLLFAVLFFSGCQAKVPVHTVIIAGGGGIERGFLESLLSQTELTALGIALVLQEAAASAPARENAADIIIEFVTFWESEPASGDSGEGGFPAVPLSRTWYVPREDALAGRQDVSLTDCLDGKETLVPLGELTPPFIALRVNGMAVDDPEYPLRRVTGVRVRPGDKEGAAETGVALEEAIRKGAQSFPAAEFPEAGPPELLWIASAGDLMLGRGAERILLNEGAAGLFGGTAAILHDADLALVNLEGAVTSRGTKTEKAFNFRFSPSVALPLREAGIDAVLLANNHAFDWGTEGFLDTLNYLEKAGIGVLGAGRNEDAAARPFVFQKGSAGARVFGLASYPVERSGWDGRSVAAGENRPGILHTGRGAVRRISAALADETGGAHEGTSNDLLAVLFHGGDEWSFRPNRAVRELCRELILAGADLIIGSHPHIVQGFEWVEEKPVFWSLGNFVFAGMENTGGGDKGLCVRLGFWGKRLVYLEPFPLTLTGPRTDLAPFEEIEGFYALSRELR